MTIKNTSKRRIVVVVVVVVVVDDDDLPSSSLPSAYYGEWPATTNNNIFRLQHLSVSAHHKWITGYRSNRFLDSSIPRGSWSRGWSVGSQTDRQTDVSRAHRSFFSCRQRKKVCLFDCFTNKQALKKRTTLRILQVNPQCCTFQHEHENDVTIEVMITKTQQKKYWDALNALTTPIDIVPGWKTWKQSQKERQKEQHSGFQRGPPP